jgi:hypothetical protein
VADRRTAAFEWKESNSFRIQNSWNPFNTNFKDDDDNGDYDDIEEEIDGDSTEDDSYNDSDGLDKGFSYKEDDHEINNDYSDTSTPEIIDLFASINVDHSGKHSHWPNYPLLLKRASAMFPSHLSPQERATLSLPIHIHKPEQPEMSEFPIESDTFIGKAFIIIAKLKDSPHSFFQSKEVKFEAVFQGRFKRYIPYSRVYTGQAHKAALPHIPSEWLVNVALKFMTRLQPAIAVDLKGTKPYFLSPLICTAQKIVISKPGEEPCISYGIESIEENMSLLGPSFPKMSSHKRKVYFSKKENLKQYYFEPDSVYTFDFFQHRLNLATFMIDLGFIKYDLRKMLMSKPIQIMAVEWEGPGKKGGKKGTGDWKFLYNVEIWHKRCIKKTLRTGNDANVKENGGLLQSMSPQGGGESEHVRSSGDVKVTSDLPSDSSRHPSPSISASLHPIPLRVTLASEVGGESSAKMGFESHSDNDLEESTTDRNIRSRSTDIVSALSGEAHIGYSNSKNTLSEGSGIPFPSTPVTASRPKLSIFRRNSCGMVTLNHSSVITPHDPNPTCTPTPRHLEAPTKPKLARNKSVSITQKNSIDIMLKDGQSSQSKSAPASLSKLSPISLVKKKLNLLSSKGNN